jgi:hypothetical protein
VLLHWASNWQMNALVLATVIGDGGVSCHSKALNSTNHWVQSCSLMIACICWSGRERNGWLCGKCWNFDRNGEDLRSFIV